MMRAEPGPGRGGSKRARQFPFASPDLAPNLRTATKRLKGRYQMLKKLIAATAALSLAAAPAVAQSSASKLSVAGAQRTGATVEGENLAGVSTLALVAIAAAVVALAVFVVFDDDDAESA
jgi:cobalamin biosynthesis Mg chelatase CobN